MIGLNISGMHCASCAKLIKEDLADADGIESINIYAESGKAKITFFADNISVNEIIQKIETLGYGVKNES